MTDVFQYDKVVMIKEKCLLGDSVAFMIVCFKESSNLTLFMAKRRVYIPA